jgi:hypothetical protein
LKGNNKFLNRLKEGLGGLELVNNRLHVGLVLVITIKKGRPLLRGDVKTCFHRNLHNLGIVLLPQGRVCPVFFMKLKKG